MTCSRVACAAVCSLLLLSAVLPARKPEDGPLPERAFTVLRQHCGKCHGARQLAGDLDLRDPKTVLVKSTEDTPYIVPKKPAESLLFKRFGNDMPPREADRLKISQADRDLLERWIREGALLPGAPPPPKARVFISQEATLSAMRDHLRNAARTTRPADLRYLRFFTLTHLHNDPARGDDDLNLTRAALSKALNSLHWAGQIVVPQAIDPQKTVYVVDVRDLGWDKPDRWHTLLRAYPYGLRYDESPDRNLAQADKELFALGGPHLPYVRADWFVAVATRPPLYHDLLQLPRHAGQLEKDLGVHVTNNFLRDRLARAGFTKSGVSKQNRMVERHDAKYGAYWKSYDFLPGGPRGNLATYPLGPVFKDNPFAAQAFQHAGGEIIFHLPNHLQGYLLINDKDERIDEGPINVVSDSKETSGTPAIVNGLSCMACHKNGMLPCKDEIRLDTGLAGLVREKVEALYPEEKKMNGLLRQDEERFLAALEKAIGPFLRQGANKDKPIREFPEPVGPVAVRYVGDVTLAEAAFELGLKDPRELGRRMLANRKVKELGLAGLARGGVLKRAEWERGKGALQELALELEIATPRNSP